MSTAFGLAGWHFGTSFRASRFIAFNNPNALKSGRKPTSSSSEAPVSMAPGTEPWQNDAAKAEGGLDSHFKYQYHPGGDPKKAPKDAPSALHSVIVPNVTLTKVSGQSTGAYG